MLKKSRLPEPEPSRPPEAGPQATKAGTVIASGLTIKGALTARESVVIRGLVEGKIVARQNDVTIEANGHLKGSVVAKIIVVKGKVEGNLCGDEKVIVCQTSSVQGKVCAPRVRLVDGCKFNGTVNMDTKARASAVEAVVKARAQEKTGVGPPPLH